LIDFGGDAIVTRDSISYIKGTLKRKKDKIKHIRMIKCLSVGIVVSLIALGGIYAYSQQTVDAYFAKEESLNDGFVQLEEQKRAVENQKQELQEEQERIASEAELVAQNNERLIKENINLQNTLLKAAATGGKPQNDSIPEESELAVDYEKLTYVGEFEGTAYTPSPDECSNGLGYTASGKAIVPGVSIAVDTTYWKLRNEILY